MLQKHSKENTISFLDIDYDALGKEVEAINEAKNIKPKEEVRLAKQTSGNMYKQKSLIAFLEEDSVPAPETKTEEHAAPTPASKLENKFKPESHMTGIHNIRSARSGTVTDTGGPRRYMQSATANSIWDPDNLARLAEAVDRKDATKAEQEQVHANRREAEDQRMNDLAETLKGIDQRKDSHINSPGTYGGSAYKAPSGNSIFDDQHDFSRIPEKTAGEQAMIDAEADKQEILDQNVMPSSKSLSSKDVVSRLFDGLMSQRQK
tara:strand:+ start:3080 stop:3868 length:789 start_codon:yes stop_codon:yes gene_type:complete